MDFDRFQSLLPFKYSSRDVFYTIIQPMIYQRFTNYLHSKRRSNRGRKRTVDLNQILKLLFCQCDNQFKDYMIQDISDISISTYKYYRKLLTESHILQNLHNELVTEKTVKKSNVYITDSFTVKSVDGSIGLGRNPTDRGRKGLKVSLICDLNLVTHAIHIAPANIHDSKLLIPTINNSVSPLKGKPILADSGYAGRKYIRKIHHETSIRLISKPKKTRSKTGRMSHELSHSDQTLLDAHRNKIELLNGQLRRMRSINIKHVKKISTYRTFLYLGILVNTIIAILKSTTYHACSMV